MTISEGKFFLLTKPSVDYRYGTKRGIEFLAGDKDGHCASVFVETENKKFAEVVRVGQSLLFAEGKAKFQGNFKSHIL